MMKKMSKMQNTGEPMPNFFLVLDFSFFFFFFFGGGGGRGGGGGVDQG